MGVLMADFGPGFKDDGEGRAECRKHGKAFQAPIINDQDVAETVCLVCADAADPTFLSKQGHALLRKMRSDAAARKVTKRRGDDRVPAHACSHCGHVTYGGGSGNVLHHKPDCLLRREAERAAEVRRG